MLARVRIKTGESEIEIDSRDFYVDNDTIPEVMVQMSRYLPQTTRTKSKDAYPEPDAASSSSCNGLSCASPPVPDLVPRTADCLKSTGLENMRDAEIFEPELSDNCDGVACENERGEPVDELASAEMLSPRNIREGILSLRDADGFFDSPRTATDITGKFWEYRWRAGSLDISKVLAEMTLRKQLVKNPLSDTTPSTYVSPDVPICEGGSCPEPAQSPFVSA